MPCFNEKWTSYVCLEKKSIKIGLKYFEHWSNKNAFISRPKHNKEYLSQLHLSKKKIKLSLKNATIYKWMLK